MYHAILASTIPRVTIRKCVHTVALILSMVVLAFVESAARPHVQPEDMPLIQVPVPFVKCGMLVGIDAVAVFMRFPPLTVVKLTALSYPPPASVVLPSHEVSLVEVSGGV